MKKLIIILAAAAMAGCGIYKPYTRPEEIKTDGLYGQGVETVDTMTLGNISWQEMFTDPYLQQLIQQGLDNNTDLQSAYWRVKEAEATLKSARLAYLPSFNFAQLPPQSSYGYQQAPFSEKGIILLSWLPPCIDPEIIQIVSVKLIAVFAIVGTAHRPVCCL